VTTDDVPRQLATLGARLLEAGWVMTNGNTYRHPDAPRLRLNTQYMRCEATVTVSTWDGDREHVSRVILYYRGANPLDYVLKHGPTINPKIFPGFRDNTPDGE